MRTLRQCPGADGGRHDAGHFSGAGGGLPAKQQTVEDKQAILRDLRGDLRRLADKVDTNNKRWYAAWQGEFPARVPEGDALAQITTEGGGNGGGTPGEPPAPPAPPEPPAPTLPGVASLGSVQMSGLDVTLMDMSAEGAETFDVELRPVGGSFASQATGVGGSNFAFTVSSAGDYEVRIAGRNATGLGPWSDPALVHGVVSARRVSSPAGGKRGDANALRVRIPALHRSSEPPRKRRHRSAAFDFARVAGAFRS